MDFYMGQIMPLAIGYAPKYTAMASGQTLPVNQNQALYSLLGITFGGNGQPGGTFGLPNLGGRTAVGYGRLGSVMPLGEVGGEANHTLSQGEMPAHVHSLYATNQGSLDVTPEGMLPGTVPTGSPIYGDAANLVPLGGAPMAVVGSSQPHSNMQPSLALNFVMVLYGIFPSRS